MKLAIIPILATMLVAWAGPGPAANSALRPQGQGPQDGQNEKESAPAESLLVVKVRGTNAGKLAGARVELTGAGPQNQVTDANGRAAFKGLTRGKQVSIEVFAEGWQARRESLLLDDEREETAIELSPLITRLRVTVEGIDAEGKKAAISTCTITVSRGGQILQQRTTGDPCAAVFKEVPQDKVKVTVVAKGFETGVAQQELTDTEAEVLIKIEVFSP